MPIKLAWMQYLLKPGFQHCVVLLVMDDGTGVALDFKVNTIDTHMLDAKAVEKYIIACKRLGGHILKVKYRADKVITRVLPGVLTPNYCVTFVKNFLGIKAHLVLTPYQLYKYIKKTYEYTEV